MDCDYCKVKDLNAVLILRKNRFRNPKGKLAQNVSRVCLKCAKKLSNHGDYYLGSYWEKTLKGAIYL